MVLRKLGAKTKKLLSDARTRRKERKEDRKKYKKKIEKLQKKAFRTSYKEQAIFEAEERGRREASRQKGRGGGGINLSGILDNLTSFSQNYDPFDGMDNIFSSPRSRRKSKSKRKSKKKKGS